MRKIKNGLLLIILCASLLILTGCGGFDTTITYGEKGEYGEYVTGGTNLIYKIPAGTYKVSLSAGSSANVGFLTIRDSNDTNYNVVEEYKFDFEDNNRHTITIKEGQYIHITVNTIFHIYE